MDTQAAALAALDAWLLDAPTDPTAHITEAVVRSWTPDDMRHHTGPGVQWRQYDDTALAYIARWAVEHDDRKLGRRVRRVLRGRASS